ncbi:MAG: hypothetical protein HY319_26200 [Armatimonadetes bacterium]|nr:hypothetical protein [Armatimonadota bacterium]
MRSYCLNHQERIATTRCAACLKPLCSDCVYSTGDGGYCSSACHENAQASAQRIAELKAKEAGQKGPNFVAALVKLTVWAVIIAGLITAWPYFPASIRLPVEQFLKQIGIG